MPILPKVSGSRPSMMPYTYRPSWPGCAAAWGEREGTSWGVEDAGAGLVAAVLFSTRTTLAAGLAFFAALAWAGLLACLFILFMSFPQLRADRSEKFCDVDGLEQDGHAALLRLVADVLAGIPGKEHRKGVRLPLAREFDHLETGVPLLQRQI